jgi:hypothetical protein
MWEENIFSSILATPIVGMAIYARGEGKGER